MESIIITFLGTGNAVPTKARNHTAIVVSFLNEHILVDCGEGAQRQYKYTNLNQNKMTKLLITHWHGDHTLGIPGLFQSLAMSDYNKTLNIYGPKGTQDALNLIQQLYRDFHIKTKVTESIGKLVETPVYIIESLPMSHGTPVLGYSIILKDRRRLDKNKIEKLKLPNSPILGDLQAGKDIVWNNKKIKAKEVTFMEKGKKITIILDTNMTENAIKLARNADILILESTFSEKESEKASKYQHLTSKQAATIAKKAKAKKLILTHISQRYEHNTKIIEKEAKKVFKNTIIVKDLDTITV